MFEGRQVLCKIAIGVMQVTLEGRKMSESICHMYIVHSVGRVSR